MHVLQELLLTMSSVKRFVILKFVIFHKFHFAIFLKIKKFEESLSCVNKI